MSSIIEIAFPLGTRGYRVLVGEGAIESLAEVIPTTARRAAVVTQAGIGVNVSPGIENKTFHIEDGENEKSLSTVESLCREFARWGLTRNDVVIGVGGGLVTDVAGFAAAVYHRGVPVVHVATTLLGQIDASIGGKTGVNIAEGKNLIGAYWQPAGVICDTALLASLPPREYRSGLGEMAKYHFLGGDDLDGLDLPQRVARCVQIKADVVCSDEHEGGRRVILNYGHTLGHALEIAGSFDLRHGEAVAIGLVYAAEVAFRLDRIDVERVAEHRRVVASYDLSTELPFGVDHHELLELFGRDKKAVAGVTFVLDGPDGIESVENIDSAVLLDALSKMA